MKQFVFAFVAVVLFGLMPPSARAVDTLVATNSVWKYLDDGTDQGTNWISPSFNDTAWKSGPAELGYGDVAEGRPEATVVEDNPTPGYNSGDTDRYITTYFRRAFNVANPSSYALVQLRVLRDDGAVVYLNGKEVFRSNMPGGIIDYLTPASGSIPSADETRFFPC